MGNDDFAFVTNGADYALYVSKDGRTYTLADHGTDPAGNAQRMVRVLMQNGSGARLDVSDRVHLNAGGVWRQPLTKDDFAAPTPRMRLEAEIANLLAEGTRKNDNDAFGGGYGNAGQHLINRAEALQHALDVLCAED